MKLTDFEKLEGSRVRHRDLGYILHITGRFGIEYIEGDWVADIEVGLAGPSVIIYASTLKWREDDEPDVEPERAEEILDRIVRGFEAMGSWAELDRR